eukprot:4088594-Amphidinium_carterae.1
MVQGMSLETAHPCRKSIAIVFQNGKKQQKSSSPKLKRKGMDRQMAGKRKAISKESEVRNNRLRQQFLELQCLLLPFS